MRARRKQRLFQKDDSVLRDGKSRLGRPRDLSEMGDACGAGTMGDIEYELAVQETPL